VSYLQLNAVLLTIQKAVSYVFMALEALRPSDHLLQCAWFIGPRCGKNKHHNGPHYNKQDTLNHSHNSCLSQRALATSGASCS
jgi:hypothetical protein